MIVQFITPTAIPLDSFALMGINAKTDSNAIGRFGTGLKYAVAVILRHGGDLKVFVDGVEYMFYLAYKEFRGKTFRQVRMRRRKGYNKWFSSRALPFTIELGKDWQLWQAYRELESNTRDERGVTRTFQDPEDPEAVPPAAGTVIQVNCPGFYEQIAEAEVFLNTPDQSKLVYSDDMVDIYDLPSKHLYYRGIRVYTLRYPARLTYDFKRGSVTLTEDRTAANNWYLIHMLSIIIQSKMDRRDILYKALSKSRDQNKYSPTFETMELNFDYTEAGSEHFSYASAALSSRGLAGKSIAGYLPSYTAYKDRKDNVSIDLPRSDWDNIELVLKFWLERFIGDAEQEQRRASAKRLLSKIQPATMF